MNRISILNKVSNKILFYLYILFTNPLLLYLFMIIIYILLLLLFFADPILCQGDDPTVQDNGLSLTNKDLPLTEQRLSELKDKLEALEIKGKNARKGYIE